jgi:hypothetical protein
MLTLVLISKTGYSSKRSIKVKMTSDDLSVLSEERERLYEVADKLGTNPSYGIYDEKEMEELREEIKAEQSARRKVGAQKAKATIAKEGKKFVLCPTCGKKSKKFFSEMGGLETRQCQRGHRFEYDRWIDERAWAGPCVGAIFRPASV